MNTSDIKKIEENLKVTLPSDFVDFIISERNYDSIDEVSVMDEADSIIEATFAYREGKWNQQWPQHIIYIGDESDACPYALDCITGALNRLDHGNPDIEPLESFSSFKEFLKKRNNDYEEYLENENAPPLTGFAKWKSDMIFNLQFYGPAIIAIFIFFVVMPTIVYSIRELYRWVTG